MNLQYSIIAAGTVVLDFKVVGIMLKFNSISFNFIFHKNETFYESF